MKLRYLAGVVALCAMLLVPTAASAHNQRGDDWPKCADRVHSSKAYSKKAKFKRYKCEQKQREWCREHRDWRYEDNWRKRVWWKRCGKFVKRDRGEQHGGRDNDHGHGDKDYGDRKDRDRDKDRDYDKDRGDRDKDRDYDKDRGDRDKDRDYDKDRGDRDNDHGGGRPDYGEHNRKVKLCHNGHTIEVSKHAVSAHKAHGDTWGECRDEYPDHRDNDIGGGKPDDKGEDEPKYEDKPKGDDKPKYEETPKDEGKKDEGNYEEDQNKAGTPDPMVN